MAVKLLNLQEAADFLQIDAGDLRQMAVCGEIPCVTQGVRMMFEHEELDNWYTHRLLHHITIRHCNNAKSMDQLRLADYCRLETMETCLPGKTKSAVLKALTDLAERSELLYDPKDFLENIRRREEVAPTAMAEGVALVHPESRDEFLCEGPFVAIAKAAQPVFFGEENGGATDLFFVLASPDNTEHLQLLASICRLIENTDLLTRLREAQTPEEMLAAVQL